MSAQMPVAPVTGVERLVAIDTLRGVAVLGILVMNIYAFAMPFIAYLDPLAFGGTEWYNLGTWFLTHILFDQKFMAIFSILYGAGLVMMSSRSEAAGRRMGGIWYRRCFWLLLIGAAHGYLLWVGDILFAYALMGMLIYFFRNLSPRTLIAIGCVLLTIGMLFGLGGAPYLEDLQSRHIEALQAQQSGDKLSKEQVATLDEWEQMAMITKSPEEQVREDLAAYQGNYWEVVQYRAPTVVMLQTQGMFGFIIWRVGGLMLIGMALMKLGVVSGERSRDYYRKMLVIGYGLGIPLVSYSAYAMYANSWEVTWRIGMGSLPNYAGSLLVALGHVAAVMLIVKGGALKSLMGRFTAVGRMAFTNYLLHSIILTSVFYGYGLGFFGEVPRAWQMLIVAAVVGFQLWMSPLWLKHFRFGPAEWLWRSLSYWRLQPMSV